MSENKDNSNEIEELLDYYVSKYNERRKAEKEKEAGFKYMPNEAGQTITVEDVKLATQTKSALRHAQPYLSEDEFKRLAKILHDSIHVANVDGVRYVQDELSKKFKGQPIKPALYTEPSEKRSVNNISLEKMHNYKVNAPKKALKKNACLKRVKSNIVKGICLGLVACSLLFTIVKCNIEKNHELDAPSKDSEYFQNEDNNEIIEEKIESLEDLEFEYRNGNTLTSDSTKDLSSAVVYELNNLYELYGGDLPPVIKSNVLTNIFFCENTCGTVDTEGLYVGIGQIGLSAVKDAVAKVEKLYIKINANYNYLTENQKNILDNNFYVKNVVGKDPEDLWEKCKTDAKLCAALSASAMASISDNNYTALGENENLIIMIYNAGIGNMLYHFMEKGVVILSEDKKSITIDFSKVHLLDKEKREKWNEAINYLIKVKNGEKILDNNPNADIFDVLEKLRVKVGANENYGENKTQFNYLPDGVKGINLEKEMER